MEANGDSRLIPNQTPGRIEIERVMRDVRASVDSASSPRDTVRSSDHLDSGGVGRDPQLSRLIDRLRRQGDRLRVDYQLGWKTPVIGHAWLVVRRRIHQEIRIYIDPLISQQSATNGLVAQALWRMSTQIDSRALGEVDVARPEIERLERQIADLRAEVADLKRRLGTQPGGDGD